MRWMASLCLGQVPIMLVVVLVLGISSCDSGSTLEIWARDSLTESTELAGLVLQVEGEVFRAEDLSPRPVLRVPDAGQLTIDVALTQNGEAVAEGQVNWTLHDDYEWQLDIFRQVADPTETCLGCAGLVRLEIADEVQSEPGEALWLTWGGIERGSGVVY